MIQITSTANVNEDFNESIEKNKFLENVQIIEVISSSVISNGATYGEMLLSVNKKEYKKLYLDIGYDRLVKLIIWDETIDIKFLKDIANTYVSE